MCNEIIYDTDHVSTNVTITIPTNMKILHQYQNTTSTNVTSTVSIKFDNKKATYKTGYYVLHTVLLVIRLLFIIAGTCYHYAKYR